LVFFYGYGDEMQRKEGGEGGGGGLTAFSDMR